MMFQALYTDEPVSVNANNTKRKEEYQKNILELFSGRYSGELSSGCPIRNKKCYFLMMYFYKGRKQRDIDNILKYTIDALRKKIYNAPHKLSFEKPMDTKITSKKCDQELCKKTHKHHSYFQSCSASCIVSSL